MVEGTTFIEWLWGLDKGPFAVVVSVTSFFILQNRMKLFTQEHEIRKKYNNNVFGKLEEVLKSIVHRNYGYMYNKLKDVKKPCPMGDDKCHAAATSIPSQLHTYHLILRDVFFYTIKHSIKQLIFDNGYHHMSTADLVEYCREHSFNLFTEAITEIRIQCDNRLPDVVAFFGEAYVPEDAFDDFHKIISHCIEQHKIRDHKIVQLRKINGGTIKSIRKGIGIG